MRYILFAAALLMAAAFLVPTNADAGLFHRARAGCSAPAAACSGYARVGLFRQMRANRIAHRPSRRARAYGCAGAVGCSGAVVVPLGCSGR
jgi:hypothetical protein